MENFNGDYINKFKWKKITPLIDDLLYQYRKNPNIDKFDFIKKCWGNWKVYY